MSVAQYETTEIFRDMDVSYAGRRRKVTIECVSSGTTATLTARGIGRGIRLVLDRDALHTLSGVFTRSLTNARRANKLRSIGGFAATDEVANWTMRNGSRTQQVTVVLRADAATMTLTVTGLSRRPAIFECDPEDIRLLTWFLSKALFNVKVAQKIRG